MNLNDVFPDGMMGEGIFYALNNYNVPWKDSISSLALDLEYYGNVSGGKTISPLLRRLLVDGVVPPLSLTRLANSLYSMNALRWTKLWNTYELEYNPIENYRMSEIMSDDDTVTTYGRTHHKTGTESDDRTRTDESTDGVYGFNSSSASDSESSDRTIDDDNTHTYNLTDADTGTDTQSHSYELTRSGNIGVTTSQQMIESERSLWMWRYFYDVVFPDVDKMLTIAIYSDDFMPVMSGGGITPTGEISITSNGEYDVTEYANAVVDVPNTYTESDNGLVVHNGELVSQIGREITANGSYDTTLNNAVIVNVSNTYLSGTIDPAANVGENGDIYLKRGVVPDIYDVVEYLQSNGSQGIDTGVNANNISAFEIEFELLESPSTWNCLFGSQGNYSSGSLSFIATWNNSRFNFRCGGSSNQIAMQNALSLNTKYKFLCTDEVGFYVDDVLQGSTTKGALSDVYSIFLFGNHNNNAAGITQTVKAKIYGVTIFGLDGNILRKFIPVKRKSDDVIGMYELVSESLYTNIGSGSFSVGEVISLDSDIITSAFVKVNDMWQNLIGTDINDII